MYKCIFFGTKKKQRKTTQDSKTFINSYGKLLTKCSDVAHWCDFNGFGWGSISQDDSVKSSSGFADVKTVTKI